MNKLNKISKENKSLQITTSKNEEQLFTIPSHWNWTSLGDLCNVATGKLDANASDENGAYPFFTCAQKISKINQYAFDCEAILIAGNGDFNVKYYCGKFNAYQRTYVLSNIKINAKYLFLYITFTLDVMTKNNRGSTIKYIRLGDITNHKIAVPPLNEQEKIAQKLEKILGKINQTKQLIEEVKESSDIRKASILLKAFSGDLTKNWRKFNFDISLEEINKVNKEVEFNIPSSWKWIEAKLVFKEFPRNGYSPKSVNYITNTKTLKLGAITRGYFNGDEYKYVDEEISSDSYLWLKCGDFLIQRANSIEYVGTSAIYTGKDNEFIYPDLIMKGRIDESVILPQYLVYWINSTYGKKYFRENATGTAGNMPKINKSILEKLTIPVPSIEEQEEILKQLERLFENEAQIEQIEEYLQLLISNLNNSVLSTGFKGGFFSFNSGEL